MGRSEGRGLRCGEALRIRCCSFPPVPPGSLVNTHQPQMGRPPTHDGAGSVGSAVGFCLRIVHDLTVECLTGQKLAVYSVSPSVERMLMVPTPKLLSGLTTIIHVKCSEDCVANSKHLIKTIFFSREKWHFIYFKQ